MRGEKLARQRCMIREIGSSPSGLTVSEVAKREEPVIQPMYLHLEDLQAVRFPLNTPAYLDQIQSRMETYLRKVAQLRVRLNGGILYLIGLFYPTEEVRMFILDRGYYGASL